ncbi:MAG: peptidase, partial [Thermoanaerobaculia bacterium]|nr:peptidase [Thermoanaerobaculia bacterium]
MNASNPWRRFAVPALALLLLSALPLGAAQFNIVNTDGAGEGLNDPTPVAPVGGNPGTTRGQQVLNVYNAAAAFWGDLIESDVVVNIEAAVNPLTCTTTGATLASAGALTVWSDFTNTDFADTWYPQALANKLFGSDLDPGFNDLAFRANTNIVNGPSAGCPFKFYLGLDGNTPVGETDLFTVMLHEVAHGLGFANFVNESTGANLSNQTDVYSQFTRDNTLGQTWAQINPTNTGNAAIAASALRCDQITWSGQYV